MQIIGYIGIWETFFLKILYPEDVSYVYEVKPARTFGGLFEQYYDEIELVPSLPADGCRTLENSLDVQDQIALVKRGGCSFLSKAVNVADSGAAAVFIYDNNSQNDWAFIDMIGDDTERETVLPAAFMLGRDGQRIVESLVRNGVRSAVLTMPYNITGIPIGQINKAPWTLW
ncbi:hypothetical protein BSL78_04488 [Apostichopus japonicus]|uniref:PA domain-containing protein n=1 Tax=Stichopus japonicus TaxID=307972 RepID=A0A2G8LEA8_STIJA|nr:hypothetical protein BSL78_04488 [Apostichopus japonicus]